MALVDKKVYQLPKVVVPLHYDLFIKPVVEKAFFEAEMNVRVKVHEPTNEVYMHAHKLDIKDAVFKFDVHNKAFKPEKVVYDAQHHMVRFFFGPQVFLPVGYGVITIKFGGHIGEHQQEGFYFNRWAQGHEMEKFWLMSGFDNFKAHYAFPCWDEPWAKATWKFEFEVAKHWTVLFNTPLEKEQVMGEYRRVHFERTPVLHPGSIGFVMGAMERMEHLFTMPSGRIMNFGIVHPKFEHFGGMKMAELAKAMRGGMFEMMEKLWAACTQYFAHYEHRFDAHFAMHKLDFVAVPNFKVYGAGYYGMVNMHFDHFWFDKAQSEGHRTMEIARVMSAHMVRHYFGHLLNFAHWNQHYLEESFVTFFKYLMMERAFPEYHVWECKFVHDELVMAMKYDQLPSTMPLDWSEKFAFYNKSTSENIFFNGTVDKHSMERMTRFGKGAVVLRMVRDYVTPTLFDKVMMEVLHKYQFRAIEPEEVWASLEFASKMPVIPMVHSWLYKEAFPIVHIAGKMAANGDFMLTLKQENVLNYYKNMPAHSKFDKFAGKWNDYTKQNAHQHWLIPIKLDFGGAHFFQTMMTPSVEHTARASYPYSEWADKHFVMDREEMSFVVPAEVYRISGGYFKLSAPSFGYVVFDYPEEHVRKHLLKHMESDKAVVSPADSMRLMHDTFTMWKLGVYSGAVFFDTMKAYLGMMKHELYRDFGGMKMLVNYMFELREICIDTADDEMMAKLHKFGGFVVKQMRAYMKSNNIWAFDKEEHFGFEHQQMVGMLMHFMVLFRDAEAKKYAVDLFWKWFQTGQLSDTVFEKHFHRAMFVAVALGNEPRALEVFFKLYQEFFRLPEARDYVIYALGFFTDKSLVEKIFHWVMSEQVMPEHKLTVLKSLMSHFPMTRDWAFAFFKNKFDFIGKHYDAKWMARSFFEWMPFRYSNEKRLEEVMAFVDTVMPLDVTGKAFWLNQRFMHMGFEHAHVHSKFAADNHKMMKEYFDKF